MSTQTQREEALPSTSSTTMNAVVIDKLGDPDVLEFREIDRPVQVSSEALIRVHAAGVNPIDAKTRAGAPVAQAIPKFPFVLGNDFAGVVVSAPYDACPFPEGTEVFGMSTPPRTFGTYAEYVSVPIQQLTKKPKQLSFGEAAAVPCAALTAWGAVVEIAKARAGQRILIHAGAGGVGHFAVQLAAYFGARVIATAGPQNLDFVRMLGAHEVIDYTSTRFEEVLDPVDVVIDLIGNVHDNTGSRSLQVLRPGGLIVNVPSGSWPTLQEEAFAAGVRSTTYKVSPNGDTLAVLGRLLDSGDLRVHIDEAFPLHAAADAHRKVESGHVRGKLVLDV